MKKLLIICLLFAANFKIGAQPLEKALSLLDFPYDSTYIEDYGRALLVKPIVAYRSFSYRLNSIDSDELIVFKPQATVYGGVGGAYKNLQLQLIFPIGTVNSTELEANDFRATDISLGLKTNSLNGALTYKQFQGFTLNEGSANEQLMPDAKLMRLGLKGFYSFNSSYSVNSAYKQTQRQKRQAGSFLLGADAFYLENNYDETLNELYNFSIIAGYAYNFIPHKKWYISPIFFAGAGLQHPKGLSSDLSEKEFSLLYDLRLSAGYNSKKLIVGFIFHYENNTLFSDPAHYGMRSLFLKFNIAYRFVFE